MTKGFVPPVYPYERLDSLRAEASRLPGGAVDCSVGTPYDPPPEIVVQALASSGTERSYPSSIGSPVYRRAAAAWVARRFRVEIDPDTQVAACIGTKEFVASLPRVPEAPVPRPRHGAVSGRVVSLVRDGRGAGWL